MNTEIRAQLAVECLKIAQSYSFTVDQLIENTKKLMLTVL